LNPVILHAARVTAALAVFTALAGCTYDYRQRTDRVGYSAGDAVKANLARETSNPTKASMYSTKGLGRNGHVVGTVAAPVE
jgi:hypothetical protein